MHNRTITRITAWSLALVLTLSCACVSAFAAGSAQTQTYTGTVLSAVNTDVDDTYARFTTDRTAPADKVEAAAETGENEILPDGLLDEPEPLSGPQALLRQAQYGDIEPQAAESYRVGSTKRLCSHYADSELAAFRYVDMVCTCVSDSVTIWHEQGVEEEGAEYDEQLAAEMDVRLPQMREFFGDKRIDTDGDGKFAIFIYSIDGENIGGYFSVIDLTDRIGRVGKVWYATPTTSNHCDCIHVQNHGYSFIMKTCLHEYQHYIEASYRFVGKNNFNYLKSTETFINEGFSTAAEHLLVDGDRYSGGFANASKPSRGLSFLHWKHDSGNYSLAFVFSQYLRTRYAALTDDLDSEIPGGSFYKTVLSSRTKKNDDDTLSMVADMLYPSDAYPSLKNSAARCRQLLYDFWMAVYYQEPEGVHGFNGESWLERIDRKKLLSDMPAGETEYPIRSGMAAFYQIPSGESDSVCVSDCSASLTMGSLRPVGYVLRYDANGGQGAPQPEILFERSWIGDPPTRSGYTFLGWALTPDATSPRYYTGNVITLSKDTTLYAVWNAAQTVVTDTSYPIRKQGQEKRNCYRFVPESDGIYKLTHSTANNVWAALYLDGGAVEPVCDLSLTDDRVLYFRMEGGAVYDLWLSWPGYFSTYGTKRFIITRQDEYYTLTYRMEHPLADRTQTCTGDTTYYVDGDNTDLIPALLGWAYSPSAQTPELKAGDRLTLTQDTTLYAVFAPDVPLPSDGSTVSAPKRYDRFLYRLRPEQDGTYELLWKQETETDKDRYDTASLLDAHGERLTLIDRDTATLCSLRAGETYYLYGTTQAPSVAASCRKTSDAISSTLTFSPGKHAYFTVTLHGKTTYTIPNYQPVSMKGKTFTGWRDENTYETYEAGDTITVSVDTVLIAQWTEKTDVQTGTVRAVLQVIPRWTRAFLQWQMLRMRDRLGL